MHDEQLSRHFHELTNTF
jgi:hypothetical protein